MLINENKVWANNAHRKAAGMGGELNHDLKFILWKFSVKANWEINELGWEAIEKPVNCSGETLIAV